MTHLSKKTAVLLDLEPHVNGEIPQYGTYSGELYVLATPENLRLLKVAPELLEALRATRAVLQSILGSDIESAIITEQVAIIDVAIAKARVKS